MEDNFSAGICSFPECRLSVCGVRPDLGFPSGPSFRPERARLSEERIFDLSRSLFEVRRFLPQARAESRNPGFGEFSQTGRGGMFGLQTFGKQAFVSRRIGVPVSSRCRQLAVRRFWPPSAAAPPGLLRKPGFRLSARAFKCDAAGFQRPLSHARNSRPTRETRAPAGMTGHGNAGVKKNGASANPLRHSVAVIILNGFSLRISAYLCVSASLRLCASAPLR